jgi:hypothetical protein
VYLNGKICFRVQKKAKADSRKESVFAPKIAEGDLLAGPENWEYILLGGNRQSGRNQLRRSCKKKMPIKSQGRMVLGERIERGRDTQLCVIFKKFLNIDDIHITYVIMRRN